RTASRLPRVWVARGSMPYSAVTQPRPLLRRKGGTLLSTVAVQRTWVSPKRARQEPSAYLLVPVSKMTVRSSSAARPLARISLPHSPVGRKLTRWRGDCQYRGWRRPALTLRGVLITFAEQPVNMLINPTSGLSDLNERSREIFRQIVTAYVTSGEPVGSRTISQRLGMTLSPAT